MNLDFLRTKIEEKFETIEHFAEAIKVHRVTVQSWLSRTYEPESSKILDIANALDCTEDDLDTLMGVSKLSVVFRKLGNTATKREIREKSIHLADTFFKIDGTIYASRGNLLPIKAPNNPLDVANYIRKFFLDIARNEPASLNDVLIALKRNNILVYFMPFRKLNIAFSKNTKSHREVAFTAIKDDRKIIFVDTERTRDGANFDICHELAHIILDHHETNKEEEKYCNRIAQELVYPALFLSENKLTLDPILSQKSTWSSVFTRFQHFYSKYDWSPIGLALALKSNDLISQKSYLRLMSIGSVFKSRMKSIDAEYFSKLDVSNFEQLEAFFSDIIFSNKDIYKPFLEIKDAALDERLSSRRLATIMNIGSGDADELIRSWQNDAETGGGQVDQQTGDT